ncbi:hypothetical protein Lbru_2149 [Legionella brunensis]|uniref:Uncharacterized protein n=1 Tax=Legionella brunensis TaxID=29422 RepID=A0A0W0SEV0_9GAMM|nr:hypothetical protein Lbru_2149 [Legionella brunensis]
MESIALVFHKNFFLDQILLLKVGIKILDPAVICCGRWFWLSQVDYCNDYQSSLRKRLRGLGRILNGKQSTGF